jgi:DNA-binding ferritin-like protein
MSFKSLFPSEMLESNSAGSLTLESIAAKLTHFHEQLHLLHWQTTSYGQHKALGKLYEFVQDFKDELVEKIMGYTGKRPGIYKIEPLTNCKPEQCVSDLMSFASDLKMYGEKNSFHDVCNLADTLSGEAAKTRYLLTLS